MNDQTLCKPQHLFNFRLRPIEDVAAWGSPGNLKLHWWGLTDGWFWMNAGGTELMRYSRQLIHATPQHTRDQPYADYQVAYFHEDLLSILPRVLDPIPSDVADHIRSPESAAALQRTAEQWAERYLWNRPALSEHATPEQHDEVNRALAFWERLFGWWDEKRKLSRGHVSGLPDIGMWREGETAFIRWTSDCDVAHRPAAGASGADP